MALRSSFWILTYAAICSTAYCYTSLWIGTAIVAATNALLIGSAVTAYKKRNVFLFAFAASSWIWMVSWFSFFGETSAGTVDLQLGQRFYSVATAPNYLMGRSLEMSKYDPRLPTKTYARMHNLYYSMDMSTQGEIVAPFFHNGVRVGVCISGLAVGILVGAAFSVCSYRKATKGQSHAVHAAPSSVSPFTNK